MIKVLPRNISELIAAGEVVDRPVSVVKELVENSIDAGASDITVEIKNGGITYIRVSDNGCGIPRGEAPTAFLRHATSKISNADQLNSIETLGFRGEALAAICAVSRTEMITKSAEEEHGTAIRVIAGDVDGIDDAGCPTGTTLIVRDLFSFTPARMKFLKKDSSEAAAVASFMDRIALANTGVAFKFIKDGREELHTPGDGRLDSAVNAVFGMKFIGTLSPVEGKSWGISVSGYTTAPAYPKANRNMQIFFVNGRLVRSKTFTAALDAAYANLIPSGRYPACVLNIQISPSLVDINVHPAKLEVRFTDEHAVFDAVYHAVKSALLGRKESDGLAPSKIVQIEEMKHERFRDGTAAPLKPLKEKEPYIQSVQTVIPDTEIRVSMPLIPAFREKDAEAVTEATPNEPQAEREVLSVDSAPTSAVQPSAESQTEQCKDAVGEKLGGHPHDSTKKATDGGYHYVGEIYRTYLIFENADGILLVDKHAAHERIIFNRLKKSFKPESDAQLLISPVTVSLDKQDSEIILSNTDTLASLGFEVDDFGGGEVIVRSVPVKINDSDVAALIQLIADRLPKGGKRSVGEAFYDDVLHSVACKAAVKAGTESGEREPEAILRMLAEDPQARFCPHGRPVCFEIKRSDIDRQFLR